MTVDFFVTEDLPIYNMAKYDNQKLYRFTAFIRSIAGLVHPSSWPV
jgi:hypothetical protein